MKFTEEIEGYRGKKNTKDIRILDIDPKLHQAFKNLCANERKSMIQKLKEMIEKEVSQTDDGYNDWRAANEVDNK